MSTTQERLRALPSIDRLLSHPTGQTLLARYRHQFVTDRCRAVLDAERAAIRDAPSPGDEPSHGADALIARVAAAVEAAASGGFQRVVNATGTVLHTNLGRALLAPTAIDAMVQAARHPVNLEYDVETGARGRRERPLADLLCQITGAEAATVVNNNAAAVLLALNTLAEGREVIVSRGELVEIGGAFRIPEIMAKSGAVLKEVGTTNRTHPQDVEGAITERTGLLLKVHTSNYRIVGFAAEVPLEELVAIGQRHGIPVMEDLGSGALVDLGAYGLPREPVVGDRVALGPDVVTFSGDKVLGGPQAGLLVGSGQAIDRCARNPLHRALRCDKLTLSALEATLRIYQQSATVADEIPTLALCLRPESELDALGQHVLPLLRQALGEDYDVRLESSASEVGSGALPTEEIPTRVIAIVHPRVSAQRIAERFRRASPPILGRIKDDRFLLDLRTVVAPTDVVPHEA